MAEKMKTPVALLVLIIAAQFASAFDIQPGEIPRYRRTNAAAKTAVIPDGKPAEFSDQLPYFQFDKAAPDAKTIGTVVFQVQAVGSMTADLDPGFLVVLANSVVLASDCGALKKGDIFVAEFPEMAAALDQSILYPNQIESGDVITIAVTTVGVKRIGGIWKEKKPAKRPETNAGKESVSPTTPGPGVAHP